MYVSASQSSIRGDLVTGKSCKLAPSNEIERFRHEEAGRQSSCFLGKHRSLNSCTPYNRVSTWTGVQAVAAFIL